MQNSLFSELLFEKQDEISLIPLGGLGEIGLNCLAVEYRGSILVIDAGLMFPDESMPGVDLVIPDFSHLFEHASKIVGVVITHGHEDHIGALGYLMKEVKAPIVATRLTLALIGERLREHHLEEQEFVEIAPRQQLTLGPFELEFISVNHSILDGVAVAINTPMGAIVHTGDFKIDQSPSAGDQIDLYKFAEYGEKGVLALLSDSTNAEVPGFTDSERTVGEALEKIFKEAPGRIILACFASSLARIRQVSLAAKNCGRKIIFDGRGMINNVQLAQSLGYLNFDPEVEINWAEAPDVPDEELVIVATGSQGEPMSAFARMAYNEHKHVKIKEGDTIILSARSIPGHEKAITQLVNRFYRLGASVVDGRAKKVHASGHGQAEELKLMINLTRPKYLVPVHGEVRQLVRHGEIALSLGFATERIWVLENGKKLTINSEQAYVAESVSTGRKLVDGNRLGEPEDPVLRSRLKLANGGLVVASVAISALDGHLLAAPGIIIDGVHYENDLDLTLEAQEAARRSVLEWQGLIADRPSPDDLTELRAVLQKDLRKLFKTSLARRLYIIPQILLIEE